MDAVYDLGFGPEYHWRARVTRYVPETDFELEFITADDDWTGTHPSASRTQQAFRRRFLKASIHGDSRGPAGQ